jgi:hypothetical protein
MREVLMFIWGMVAGAGIFVTGLVVGMKLDSILLKMKLSGDHLLHKVRRRNPFEGKNGLLSYRNIKLRSEDVEDDDD